MIKNKIIALMTCGILVTTGIAGGALISNKSSNTNEKTIQNHVLLAAPNLNDLAVVINTNVNPLVLYSSPNSNSSIESYISVGEMLNYTATSNPNFYKVTVQETGATGYISASNMQIIQSGLNKAYENTNKNGQVINVTYDVKLMSSPDVHSQILGSYKNNTQITVLGKQDQWYKVNIDGQTGYMYQEYVGIDNNGISINSNGTNSTGSLNQSNNINNLSSPNKQNEYNIELENANAINMPTVTGLNSYAKYYNSKISNLINKTNQIIASNPELSDAQMSNMFVNLNSLWSNLNKEMINTINSKLNEKQKAAFNSELKQINEFNNNEYNESVFIEKSNGWGSVDGILNISQVLMLTQQETFTLYYSFIEDNGINPISNINNFEAQLNNPNQSKKNNLPQRYLDTYNSNIDIINAAITNSNNIMNNVQNSHSSITLAYKQIRTVWINAVDKIYNNMRKTPAEDYNSGSTPYEFDNLWLNYKYVMLNIATNMYQNNQQSELAKDKMAIKLTQIECYMLINQFA